MGGVSVTGLKTPLVFIDEGIKINKDTYLKFFFILKLNRQLKKNLLLWINLTFGEGGITLQDSTITQMENLVQNWCKNNMARFWTKEMWPPSSPDLNPMDLSVWSILKSKACSSNHQSIDTLKHKLVHCWDDPAETTHAACSQVVNRLKCIV